MSYSIEYFECQCCCEEHMVKLAYDPGDNEIYFAYYLNDWDRLYKRIWSAIKYIFKKEPCRWGHFDCTLLHYKDTQRMIKVLQQVKEPKKHAETKREDLEHYIKMSQNRLEEMKEKEEKTL